MKLSIRAVLAIVVALVTLEVCARVDDWINSRAPLLGAYSVESLYQTDGGVKRGRPFARYRNWRLNSLGFRGPEVTPGRQRILSIGASETFGMLEREGREFPRQLEEMLNQDAGRPRYDVVNFSYFGMKLPTANALLPEVIREVHPQIAVIYLTYGGYIGAHSVEAFGVDDTLNPWTPRLVEKLNDLGKAAVPMRIQTWLKRRYIDNYVGTRTAMTRIPEDRVAYLRADLAQLVGTLRNYGVTPVIVTHANRFTAQDDPLRQDLLVAWRRFSPLITEEGLLEMEVRFNDCARRFAMDSGVVLVDAAAAMPGGSRYFTDHVHFTEEGARTLASLIAQRITPLLREELVHTGQ